jgi:hypothetical protein
MVTQASSRLTNSCSDTHSKKCLRFRISKQGVCAMNFRCKLLLWSCLCCLLAMPVQAQQDGQGHAALRHHPPQDQALHERFHSKWHMPDNPSVSCCNNAECHPTEIKYVDGDIYAKRSEDGKYIPIPHQKVERNRDNPDGRNHLCSLRLASSTHPITCPALEGAT